MREDLTEATYRKLQKFLDGQPCGFPATEDGSDIESLQWMFTPEQAEVEIHMRSIPEPAAVIAKRCDKPVAEVTEILETMVTDGLIMPVREGDKNYYMAMHYMVGFGENQQSHRLTPERAEILQKWTEASGFLDDFTRQRQMRVAPVGEAVEVPKAAIAPYNNIKDIIRSHEVIATSPCCCRVIRKNLGQEACNLPVDNELTFGVFAQYRIDSGFGRRVSQDEALSIIDAAEENAMVLSPVNTKEETGMCICCSCCCYWLEGLKRQDRPVDYVQSSYQVSVDAELCNECGTCLERCQMEALTEGDGTTQVDLARCIGCGLCVTRCQEGAMSLVPRAGLGEPPGTYLGGLAGIARDRGLPMGKNAGLMNRTSFESFLKQWKFLNKVKLTQPVLSIMEKLGRL
jgi:H+/Na+-translocating ferredoxin:NAD+ oxidoreductase subunit B